MEKELGFFQEYKNMNEAERAEIRNKKRKAGQQIHLTNVQESENARIQAEAEREAKIMQSLVEQGKTEEEAIARVKANRELQEKRELDMLERRRRQKEIMTTKKGKF